jgi:glycosyltransferase involved in cell wall biosynthesis
MKVAILCPTYHTYQGVSRVVERQAKDNIRQGNEVSIFCLKASMSPPAQVILEIIGMPNSFLKQRVYRLIFPLDVPKTIRYLRKLKGFDVIYSHEYPLHWLAYFAKKYYGTKYIYYNHHFNPPQAFPNLSERIYVSLRFVFERWLIKKADGAICISEYSRHILKKTTGIDGKVVYNTIDKERFRLGIDGTKIRLQYSLGDAPIILFVGHVSPTKSVELLIMAFKSVKQYSPRSKLLIVGSHPYKKYYLRLRHITDNSVIFVGEVSDSEMPLFYAACDVYATASLWEGFNLPLVEAQACGKPVVAFSIGPHPEVVTDPEKGKLVPAGNTRALANAIIGFLEKRTDN